MVLSVAGAWVNGQPWKLMEKPELSYRQVPLTDFEIQVPLGWEEESVSREGLTGTAFGYGHLLRDAAQFIVEFRPLGQANISAENVRMILKASQDRMEEQGPKVEWVDAAVPFIRQMKMWPSGILTLRLVRVQDGFLQSFYWESIGESEDKAIFVDPQPVFESIRFIFQL